ncbi:MAG: hypothetical protein F2697_00785 [Actinobacteria bacterium]|nr:hypothetical protein [Actinomycetota bacterium]
MVNAPASRWRYGQGMFGRARQQDQALAYLTVVTYGRTGSTAIQAALNALPGVVIRGENYSAMRGLREYLQAVAETADRHHAGRPDHPWYGSARLDPPAVLNDLRRHVVEFILRPSRGTRVIGFKEVRYEPGHFATYELMLDYLIFLGQLFPGLNYLMNVRDPAEAARSGWWPGNDQALEVLGTTREWMASAVDDLNAFYGPGRACLVEYETWAADSQALIDAFDGLGLPKDDTAVHAALAGRLTHGPHGAPAEPSSDSSCDSSSVKSPNGRDSEGAP